MKKTSLGFIFVLLSLAIVSCKKDDQVAPSRILTASVRTALTETADRVFLETPTPGLIALVSVEGEPDYLIKRGSANLETSEPMHESHYFRIASVTKTFTGTVVLMLADEGLIRLDSSIAFYLPEYNIPSGNEITVRMLGNMTSGLFNYSEDPDMWELYDASGYTLYFPPDSLLAISFRHPLNFIPGTGYEYCNTNTVLLGLLIEKITGLPAWKVINEKVLKPLDLSNTYYGGSFFAYPPYNHGYTMEEEGWVDATNWNTSWGYTAGAMISTLEDMKKWSRYLADEPLLSESMKAERFNFGADNYGFCLETVKYKNERWIGHPGTISGYNTQVWYNPERKISLVIHSNTEAGLPAQALLIAYIIFLGDLYN